MRFSKLAFVGTQFVCRRQGSTTCPAGIRSLTSSSLSNNPWTAIPVYNNRESRPSTRLFSSSGPGEVTLQNIGKEAMEEIIEDYEEGGREETGYVILDVREEHEIEFTGKLSPNSLTFPLQKLMQYNAFTLEEDEFEEVFGFAKPTPDETLVFSCAAGVRSVHAANFAAESGYTKLVNYMGGANEWFY